MDATNAGLRRARVMAAAAQAARLAALSVPGSTPERVENAAMSAAVAAGVIYDTNERT